MCCRFDCEYKILERLIMLELEKAELVKETKEQYSINQQLKERLEVLEKSVAQALMRPAVSVKVRLSQDVTLPREHQRVVYDVIVMNEGNAYGPETGIFRAPVDGTYMFAVTACTDGNDRISLHIVKDQQMVIGELRSGDEVYKDCNSEVSTAYMIAGSTVWVERSNNPNEKNVRGRLQTVYWNSFTVALVN